MRLLGPKQRLLTAVRIEGVRQLEREPLDELLRQRPNRKFPVPQLAIYNLGYTFYNPKRLQARLDTTLYEYKQRIAAAGTDSVAVGRLLQKRERRIQKLQRKLDKGNAIMRIGEPPVVYDSALTAVTTDQIGIYLRSKGFFRTRVSAAEAPPEPLGPISKLFNADSAKHAQAQARSRRVTVVYNIEEGPRFKVTQLQYDIPDTAVARLIRSDTTRQLLHVGQFYDEALIGQERSRLEALLKNRGYYDFKAQYITLEADTSFVPTTVRLLVQVANPDDADHHQVYQVRRVSFITDAGLNRFGLQRDTVRRNGVDYLAYNHRFSTRILDRKLLVHPGERYSLQNTIQTQRQLSGLDVFRYVAVNYQKPANDSLRGILDATVSTTPQKRIQQNTELGGTVVANKPGPFVNYRVRIRNAFGGAEVLDVGVRAGLEGQFALANSDGDPNSRRSRLTTQLGANVNLTLPQFLVPWRTNRFFTNYSPRTRLTTSFTYVDRQQYKRTNLEATYDYIWQRNIFHQFILTPLDVSLVRSDLTDAFRDTLRKQPNGTALLQAFQPVLVPSINAASLYNDNDFTQTLDGRYLRLFAELGGPGRSLYTSSGDATNHDVANSNVTVYDFIRLNADYRRYHKLSTHQFFVWRINTGLATALTRTQFQNNQQPSGYIIPYDRYLFAGGGSSVRAWLPRRLGTGSLASNATAGLLEQPGEVLLEGSVEYRFPIYDFIYGAAFTDFGNVWTIRHQGDAQSDAQFTFNRFYREIAVGSGLGLRFDFTFLIVRLDFAAKVHDPTAPEGQRFVLPKLGANGQGDYRVQPNIGIGYPF
jgi:outer membrane protein insertion porin family